MAISLKDMERKMYASLGIPKLEEKTPKVEVPEWIWVEGYKGTDKDMKCRDYQYELGKQFDMPADSDIRLCDSGFHFCTKLEDVFGYYDIKDGNRFFKVTALVRVKNPKKEDTLDAYLFRMPWNDSKKTSKSITFTRELTTDEILDAYASSNHRFINDLTDEEKVLVREIGIREIGTLRKVRTLESIGYVHELAEYIVNELDERSYDLAMALSKQTDISMDARIIAVFSAHGERVTHIDEFLTKNINISYPIQPLSATKTRGINN